MSDKVVVRFLKAWRGYSADELAGFDSDVVEGLKAKGSLKSMRGRVGRHPDSGQVSRRPRNLVQLSPVVRLMKTLMTALVVLETAKATKTT